MTSPDHLGTSPPLPDPTWVPLWRIIEQIASAIGDSQEAEHYAKTRLYIRQAAAEGRLRIRGRHEIEVVGQDRTNFSEIYSEIPSDYWKNSVINVLATGAVFEADRHTHPEKTPYAWGAKGLSEPNCYTGLQLNPDDVSQLIGDVKGAGLSADAQMPEEEEWISAASALALLGLNFEMGKRAICKRAHAGLVKARAQRFVDDGRPTDNVDIPVEFWWAEGGRALDQNWATGDFDTWINHKTHLEAFGVTFQRSHIERLKPALVESAASKRSIPAQTEPVRLSDGLTPEVFKMNSSDKDARRELGALYAALTVKSFASGLTPAAQATAVFPAEFATSERAERADERIDALQSNYHTRLSRSPGEPAIRRVEELAQEFRSTLAGVQSATNSANFIELREAAEAVIAASMAAYGNGPKTADLRNEIVNGIRPHLIPLSALLPNKIFIGHGHSPIWREFKDFLQDTLLLPWEEFNRVPQAGIWTGERLSEILESACFAFIIMTGEDERNGELHARENVIHEIGLFQGKLGFKRAIILLEEGCKDFSNIHGLTRIFFPKNGISAKYEEVRSTLKREKII